MKKLIDLTSMKRFLILTMCAVAAYVSLSVVTSCDKNNGAPPILLGTPVLTVSDVTASGFTVSWNPVEHAVSYTYDLDGTVEEISDTCKVFDNLVPGTYKIRVRANAGDNVGFIDSEYAEEEVALKGVEDPDEPEEQPTENIRAEAYYAGDIYGTGVGNGWINFIEGEIGLDDWGDAVGEGRIVCLDLNFDLPDNPDFARLPEGTYEMGSGDGAPYTWNADGSSYVISAGSGYSGNGEITGGTVTVSSFGEDGYRIVCELSTEEDDFDFEYRGKVSFVNHSEEGEMSNLTGDCEVTELTQGSQTYLGDLFETGESEMYMVVLADDNYDLNTNFGLGQSIILYLNVPIGSSEGVPAGTYEGLLDAYTAASFPAWTGLSGIYEYGTYMGCWYFHLQEQVEARFVDGTVDVAVDGDTWVFEGDVQDGYGNTVSFVYEGGMLFADEYMYSRAALGLRQFGE